MNTNYWNLIDDWKETGNITEPMLLKWAYEEGSYFTDQDENLLFYRIELLPFMLDLITKDINPIKKKILQVTILNFTKWNFENNKIKEISKI